MDGTVVDEVLTVAGREPAKVALQVGGGAITYGDLAAATGFGAERLRSLGAASDQVVALWADRTPATVAAMIAAMRSGAAILPLDPNTPSARLIEIVGRVGPIALIEDEHATDRPTDGRLGKLLQGIPVLGAHELLRIDAAGRFARGECWATPASMAYVLFTSGSTGAPKGVIVEHRNLANLIAWARPFFAADGELRVAGLTRLTFDLAMLDVFLALTSGGTYVCFSDRDLQHPEWILRRLQLSRCTFLQTVPSIWAMVLQDLRRTADADARMAVSSLQHLVLAGEELDARLVSRWWAYAPGASRVVNMYGPSETIHVTAHAVTSEQWSESTETVPIGYPIEGAEIRLLDETHSVITGPGEGEVFISGNCVGRGYFRARQETEQRFRTVTVENGSEVRGYLSGDFAARNADGTLIFRGRRDDQVKIDGVRVHLSEIESQARRTPGVGAAFVVLLQRHGQRERPPAADLTVLERGVSSLVLFVTAEAQASDLPQKVRAHLALQLPRQLIPSRVYVIDEVPLNSNGKVDRDALRVKAAVQVTSTLRKTPADPRRAYFVAKEAEPGDSQEHPQATLVLGAPVASEMLDHAMLKVLAGFEELRQGLSAAASSEVHAKQDLMRQPTVAQYVASPYEESNVDGLVDSVRRVARSPLLYGVTPPFIVKLGETRDGQAFVTLRCHHALGGGGFVLRVLGELGMQLCVECEAERGGLADRPMPLRAFWLGGESARITVWAHGVTEHLLVDAGERRSVLHFDRERTDVLLKGCRARGVTLQSGLLAVHAAAVASTLNGTTHCVEMPVLEAGAGKQRLAGQLHRNLPQMRRVHVPEVRAPRYTAYLDWAARVTFSASDVGARASATTRWNFMPVDHFLGSRETASALVPLDMYEPLPPLGNSLRISALPHIHAGEVAVTVRSAGQDELSGYVRAFVRDCLDMMRK